MGKISILIVDDHPIFSEIISHHFEDQVDMYVAAIAGNGQQAIDYLSRYGANVVLMDTHMPHMNGFEATQIINNYFPKTHTITTILNHDLGLLAKMLDAGATGFVSKQAPSEHFFKAVKQVYQKGIYYDTKTLKAYAKYAYQRYPFDHLFSIQLTFEEKRILQLLLDGFTPEEIAYLVNKSEKDFLEDVLKRFHSKRTIELIQKAIRHHWIDLHGIKNGTYLY